MAGHKAGEAYLTRDDLMKHMYYEVKLKGRMRLGVWIGLLLIRLGAWIIGVNYHMQRVSVEGDDGI